MTTLSEPFKTAFKNSSKAALGPYDGVHHRFIETDLPNPMGLEPLARFYTVHKLSSRPRADTWINFLITDVKHYHEVSVGLSDPQQPEEKRIATFVSMLDSLKLPSARVAATLFNFDRLQNVRGFAAVGAMLLMRDAQALKCQKDCGHALEVATHMAEVSKNPSLIEALRKPIDVTCMDDHLIL